MIRIESGVPEGEAQQKASFHYENYIVIEKIVLSQLLDVMDER